MSINSGGSGECKKLTGRILGKFEYHVWVIRCHLLSLPSCLVARHGKRLFQLAFRVTNSLQLCMVGWLENMKTGKYMKKRRSKYVTIS